MRFGDALFQSLMMGGQGIAQGIMQDYQRQLTEKQLARQKKLDTMAEQKHKLDMETQDMQNKVANMQFLNLAASMLGQASALDYPQEFQRAGLPPTQTTEEMVPEQTYRQPEAPFEDKRTVKPQTMPYGNKRYGAILDEMKQGMKAEGIPFTAENYKDYAEFNMVWSSQEIRDIYDYLTGKPTPEHVQKKPLKVPELTEAGQNVKAQADRKGITTVAQLTEWGKNVKRGSGFRNYQKHLMSKEYNAKLEAKAPAKPKKPLDYKTYTAPAKTVKKEVPTVIFPKGEAALGVPLTPTLMNSYRTAYSRVVKHAGLTYFQDIHQLYKTKKDIDAHLIALEKMYQDMEDSLKQTGAGKTIGELAFDELNQAVTMAQKSITQEGAFYQLAQPLSPGEVKTLVFSLAYRSYLQRMYSAFKTGDKEFIKASEPYIRKYLEQVNAGQETDPFTKQPTKFADIFNVSDPSVIKFFDFLQSL